MQSMTFCQSIVKDAVTAVRATSVSDPDHVNSDHRVVNAVDDPVLTPSGGMQPGQLVPKGLAHPVRILGEWTIAEGDDGPCDGAGE
ncbi:unannotated protein [freshwater metagenome]|uniref:Unannotated protein n=1 Tax=freshwater metagenome TaxID=449393 RepID=A0A6J7MQ15_9ZZZZ